MSSLIARRRALPLSKGKPQTEAVAHLPNVRVITSEAELAAEVARRMGWRAWSAVCAIVRLPLWKQHGLLQSPAGPVWDHLSLCPTPVPGLEPDENSRVTDFPAGCVSAYVPERVIKRDEIKRMNEFEKQRASATRKPIWTCTQKDSVWRIYRWPLLDLVWFGLASFLCSLPYYLKCQEVLRYSPSHARQPEKWYIRFVWFCHCCCQ